MMRIAASTASSAEPAHGEDIPSGSGSRTATGQVVGVERGGDVPSAAVNDDRFGMDGLRHLRPSLAGDVEQAQDLAFGFVPALDGLGGWEEIDEAALFGEELGGFG